MPDALLQDVRYGIRQLFRQPASSLIAVVTLALGVGASSAIFTVIDATMLRPLPYPEPEQLVALLPEEVGADGRIGMPTPSMQDLHTWQAAHTVVSAAAAWGRAYGSRIVDGPQPERVEALQFTEDYLAIHGVTPIVGRDFVRADTDPRAPLVALLGYSYWQSRFGGRAEVIGETIRLDADVATIVGILPAWFSAATPLALPLRIEPGEVPRRGTGRLRVIARLRPEVTIEQARAALAANMASSSTRPAGSVHAVRTHVLSLFDTAVSRYRTMVAVLSAAVGLVLLIACVNVAGLLLARGAARQSELVVRATLGAGRWRLVRQLLTETLVLALPGGALGVLLAWRLLDVLAANMPMSMPANVELTLNARVLVLTAVLLLVTALLVGLLPALRLSATRPGSRLGHGALHGATSLTNRGGQWLIGAEVALAVVLVAGAGLMIRTVLRIAAVDLGFNADGLVTLQVVPLERSAAAHLAYYDALLSRLRAMPSLSSVGLVDSFALDDTAPSTRAVSTDGDVSTTLARVLPGYFETIGARLRAGRLPADGDRAPGLRRAVISESAARALFPDGAAVGGTFSLGTSQWTVLGVIADLRYGGPLNPRGARPAQLFLPLASESGTRTDPMMVVLRPSTMHAGLARDLRAVAESIGPRVLVDGVRTGDDWFADRTMTPRRRMVLLGLLGALGMTLALVGIFGVTAYAVTRRTVEIGIRLACGATPARIVRAVMRDAALPIVAGAIAGIGLAALVTRVLAAYLFETTPTDPVTLALVVATLVATGSMAALLPALRAAKIDPASSLRAQ